MVSCFTRRECFSGLWFELVAWSLNNGCFCSQHKIFWWKHLFRRYSKTKDGKFMQSNEINTIKGPFLQGSSHYSWFFKTNVFFTPSRSWDDNSILEGKQTKFNHKHTLSVQCRLTKADIFNWIFKTLVVLFCFQVLIFKSVCIPFPQRLFFRGNGDFSLGLHKPYKLRNADVATLVQHLNTRLWWLIFPAEAQFLQIFLW